MPEEKRTIILIDLDGTLIDTDYNSTVAAGDVRERVRRKEAQGYHIGLNSDTPIPALRVWAKRFGMTGPLLGEYGQVLARSADAPAEDLGGQTGRFRRLRSRLVRAFRQECPDAFVCLGDAVEFVRGGGKAYGLDRVAFLINGYRQCSFGVHVRRVGDYGRLFMDPDLFGRVKDLIDGVCRPLENGLKIDPDPAYELLIVHEAAATKARAVRRLIELLGPDRDYAMIGNSRSDLIGDVGHPVRCCLVANASHETIKQLPQGGLIATQPLTRGVIELLDRL